MTLQRTLRRSISCTGIGLHSGRKVSLSLKRRRPASGPVSGASTWRARDPATVGHVAGMHYATGLAHESASVDTVEHLLAALSSQEVDNVLVELNHPEVPIMDGSAAPFVYLIQEAGTAAPGHSQVPSRDPAGQPRAGRQAHRALSLRGVQDLLLDQLRPPLLRHQARTLAITPDVFAQEIAPARTFGFLKEVEMLRQRGLALGDRSTTRSCSARPGRSTSSASRRVRRHKILDAIGDLALVGYPISATSSCSGGGHALHTALAGQLLQQRSAWEIVEQPETAMPPWRACPPRRRGQLTRLDAGPACWTLGRPLRRPVPRTGVGARGRRAEARRRMCIRRATLQGRRCGVRQPRPSPPDQPTIRSRTVTSTRTTRTSRSPRSRDRTAAGTARVRLGPEPPCRHRSSRRRHRGRQRGARVVAVDEGAGGVGQLRAQAHEAPAVGGRGGKRPLREVAHARPQAQRRPGRGHERRVDRKAPQGDTRPRRAPTIALPRLLSSHTSWAMGRERGDPGVKRRENAPSGGRSAPSTADRRRSRPPSAAHAASPGRCRSR